MNWIAGVVVLASLGLVEGVAQAKSPALAVSSDAAWQGADATHQDTFDAAALSSPAVLDDLRAALTSITDETELAHSQVCHISHVKKALERTCPLLFAEGTDSTTAPPTPESAGRLSSVLF